MQATLSPASTQTQSWAFLLSFPPSRHEYSSDWHLIFFSSLDPSIIGHCNNNNNTNKEAKRTYQLARVDDPELQFDDPPQADPRVAKVLARLRQLGSHDFNTEFFFMRFFVN
jgi:hypothetical protein